MPDAGFRIGNESPRISKDQENVSVLKRHRKARRGKHMIRLRSFSLRKVYGKCSVKSR